MMSSFDPNLFMWKSHFHNGLQSSLIALLSAYFVDGLVFFLCSFLSFFVLGLAQFSFSPLCLLGVEEFSILVLYIRYKRMFFSFSTCPFFFEFFEELVCKSKMMRLR